MHLPARRYPRSLGLATCAAVIVVLTASPAYAAPGPVSGLAAALAPNGVRLTWTASGTGDPVVRDVTGLAAADYPTGRLVAPGGTADCPVAACAVDTGFSDTEPRTYAVWATDADGTTSIETTIDVPVLPPVATESVLDDPASVVLAGHPLVLAGHVTRGGLPFPGAHVWLRSSVLGTTTDDTLAGLTSAADGSLTFSLVPVRSRTYWLSFPGDVYSTASTSVARTALLQPQVSLSVSPSATAWKQQAVVSGSVSPDLGGATVAVQLWNGSAWSALSYRTLSSTSTWSVTVAPAVGPHRYRAVLLGRASHLDALSPVATLTVTPRTLSRGLSGPDVLVVEKRLAALRYDVGRVDGYFDNDLRHAVLAFQKVERLSRTGSWTTAERTRVLRPFGFVPRFRTSVLSVEIDITRQVLVLSRHGVVLHVVDVSTGSGQVYYQEGVRQVARTPRGAFRVYKKIDGIRISPLGELYKPSYFYEGYAIHGNSSVPAYPASHGCVRITNDEANRLFSTLVTGTRVYVYDE